MKALLECCDLAAGFFAVVSLLSFAWLCVSNILAIQRAIDERKRLEREGK